MIGEESANGDVPESGRKIGASLLTAAGRAGLAAVVARLPAATRARIAATIERLEARDQQRAAARAARRTR